MCAMCTLGYILSSCLDSLLYIFCNFFEFYLQDFILTLPNPFLCWPQNYGPIIWSLHYFFICIQWKTLSLLSTKVVNLKKEKRNEPSLTHVPRPYISISHHWQTFQQFQKYHNCFLIRAKKVLRVFCCPFGIN